jgi:N-acetylglucosamine transport system permease protein
VTMATSGELTSGVGPPSTGGTSAPSGLRRIGSARWRRRNLTFDKITFFLVFLVIPVAFYIGFVVSPFVQAAYFSMTDWTGFTPAMNFVGLSNYGKLFTDSTFLQAVGNNILMAIVIPIVTLGLAMFFATLVTVGGSTRGNIRGLRNSSF